MKVCGQVNIPTVNNDYEGCTQYYDTDCVIYENPIPYFGTTEPSTSTEVFNFIITSLTDARNRILILENTLDPSDHGSLSGLGDDDHPQYLTETRGRNLLLTGLNTSLTGNIEATDSVLEAFGKIQNQLSNVGDESTGLEAIDEGNGTGWRLIGRDPLNYGDIGDNAVDMSYSSGASSTVGATGDRSFAVAGINITASGLNSVVVGGAASEASGTGAGVVGGVSGVASGLISFIGGGNSLVARAYGEAAVGIYNTDYTSNDPNSPDPSNRLFSVGNGTATNARSDAFTVFQNGLLFAPSAANGDIDSAADSVLITKGWFNANVGGGGGISSIVEGTNITIDNTDPYNPIVSSNANVVGTEGYFTPVLTNDLSAGIYASQSGTGFYYTIGNLTFIEIRITGIGSTTGAGSALRIEGLPAFISASTNKASLNAKFVGTPTILSYIQIFPILNLDGTIRFEVKSTTTGDTDNDLTAFDFTAGAIWISGVVYNQ